AGDPFPLEHVHDLEVLFRILLVEGGKPRMEPGRGVAIRVDPGIVRAERLHLVEAVLDRIGFGLVAEMPLAGEIGRVTVVPEEFSDGRGLLAKEVLVAGGNDDGERRADRNAPGHERGAARRAARLTVPGGEHRALAGEAVDARLGWPRAAPPPE